MSYPKRGGSSHKSDSTTPTKATSALKADPSDSKHPAVQSMITDVLSSSVSSSGVATPTTNGNGDANAGTMREQITKRVAQKVRSDGSVLHCLAVSSYCFKIGRLTVPPVSLPTTILLEPCC